MYDYLNLNTIDYIVLIAALNTTLYLVECRNEFSSIVNYGSALYSQFGARRLKCSEIYHKQAERWCLLCMGKQM